MTLPIYIDIDGTLTDKELRGGNPLLNRINMVKDLIKNGQEVIIWTGSGTQYAIDFCKKHEIKPLACLGKPHIAVDDNPTIRPHERIQMFNPETFFGEIK